MARCSSSRSGYRATMASLLLLLAAAAWLSISAPTVAADSSSSSSSTMPNTNGDVPVDCVVGNFSASSMCSASCGTGMQEFTREIITHPAFGGMACPHLNETRACIVQPCPIDCVVSDFFEASFCSVSCGAGVQEFVRDVIRPAAFGGAECPPLNETRPCNHGPCPIDCEVSEWTVDTECTVTCGGGTVNRSRTVLVHPQFGGVECPNLQDMYPCNTRECPRPTILTDDGDMVFRYAFGKDIVFEQLAGLDPATMPAASLRVSEIQTIADYQETRQMDLDSIEVQMSTTAAQESAQVSRVASTLVSAVSADAASLSSATTLRISSTASTLNSAIESASNSLEGALGDASQSLSSRISSSVSAEHASALSSIGVLSAAVDGDLSSVKQTASTAAISSAKAYTDDQVENTLSSAIIYANNQAGSAETAAKQFAASSVQSSQSTLTIAIGNARTYASTLAAQASTAAINTANSYANNARNAAVSIARAYTDEAVAPLGANAAQVSANTGAISRCLRACGPGQYVSTWCTSTAANVCSNCPVGKFSPTTSIDGACLHCLATTCGKGQYLQICSRTSSSGVNTCANCPSGKYQTSSSHTQTGCATCSCPSGYSLYSCSRTDGPACYPAGIGVIGYNGCGEWYYGGQRLSGCTGAGNWGNGVNVWVEHGCCISDHYDQYAYSTVRLVAGRYRFHCAADDCCNIYISGPTSFYPINHGCGGCTSCNGHTHDHNLPGGQYTFRYYMHEYGGGDWWRFGFYRLS